MTNISDYLTFRHYNNYYCSLITFQYEEYFEIHSGNTVESLLVVGEGVTPVFEIIPSFKVCRLQAKLGKSADCIFQVFFCCIIKIFINRGVNELLQVENKCRAPISIQVKKVYELKGKIEPKPVIIKEKKQSPVPDSTEKKKKGGKKKEKKSKTDKKSKASSKKKGKKFSEELNENEEYSLPKNFKINQGNSLIQ